MPMTPRAGLQVADDLAAFIETGVLPGLDLDAERFWAGATAVFARFAPENRRLLGQPPGPHRRHHVDQLGRRPRQRHGL